MNRIRARFVWVLAFTLVGLGGGLMYSYATNGGYDATARMFVGTSARDAIEAAQGHVAGQERVKTYAALAEGQDLLNRAAARSGTGTSGSDLDRSVTVVSVPGTVLLEVRVHGDDPRKAALEADAVAAELMDIVDRIESPLSGGKPALGLVSIQNAQMGVALSGRFDYRTIAVLGGVGFVLGLVMASALPDRRTGKPSEAADDRNGVESGGDGSEAAAGDGSSRRHRHSSAESMCDSHVDRKRGVSVDR